LLSVLEFRNKLILTYPASPPKRLFDDTSMSVLLTARRRILYEKSLIMSAKWTAKEIDAIIKLVTAVKDNNTMEGNFPDSIVNIDPKRPKLD